MKEHPIIFSTKMVRAILEGRKTMTRRAMRPYEPINFKGQLQLQNKQGQWAEVKTVCPYGQVGDRLWVRETIIIKNGNCFSKGLPFVGGRYVADNKWRFFGFPYQWKKYQGGKEHKIPSIYMPYFASRITLEITNIRVERLQEMENKDFIKEGYPTNDSLYIEYDKYKKAEEWFICLWNSLHGKQYRWGDNPWVWVISFRIANKTEMIR